jgi:ribose transport system ATP-binding protein
VPPLVTISEVSKWYGGEHALDSADLSIGTGTVHALLGGNGSGKSTMIKIIAGLQAASGGTIAIAGQVMPLRDWTAPMAYARNLRFVHQNPGLLTDATVAENICMGRGWSRIGPQIRWRRVYATARRALESLEIDIDPRVQVSTLPYGKRTLVAIARALADLDVARGHGVLVLDEPTATLPHDEMLTVMELVRRVARSGNGVLYVSHRIEDVLSVADEVTVLRDGRVVDTRARSQVDRNQLVDLIVGTALTTTPATSSRHPVSDTVLTATGVSGRAVRDVSFSVARGEVLGIAGQADAGGDELVDAIFGRCHRAGEISVAGRTLQPARPRASVRAGLMYVPSDRLRDGVFGEMSIVENLVIGSYSRYYRSGLVRDRLLRSDARKELRQLQVRHGPIDASIGTLSGGNQQKVVLGRTLRRHPKVLLLNDPTQGVDVGAKRDIWRLVRDYLSATGACAILYSTDYEELADVTDRVLVLHKGRLARIADTTAIDQQALAAMTYHTTSEAGGKR